MGGSDVVGEVEHEVGGVVGGGVVAVMGDGLHVLEEAEVGEVDSSPGDVAPCDGLVDDVVDTRESARGHDSRKSDGEVLGDEGEVREIRLSRVL